MLRGGRPDAHGDRVIAGNRIAVIQPVCNSCPRKGKFLGPGLAIVDCIGAGRISLCAGACPMGWWDASNVSLPPVIAEDADREPVEFTGQPGDLLALALRRLGISTGSGCGCAKMRKWMNSLGWSRCLSTHLPHVVRWLMRKSVQKGVTRGAARQAILAAAAQFSGKR